MLNPSININTESTINEMRSEAMRYAWVLKRRNNWSISKALKTAWQLVKENKNTFIVEWNGKVYGGRNMAKHVYLNGTKYFLTSKPQMEIAAQMFAKSYGIELPKGWGREEFAEILESGSTYIHDLVDDIKDGEPAWGFMERIWA